MEMGMCVYGNVIYVCICICLRVNLTIELVGERVMVLDIVFN